MTDSASSLNSQQPDVPTRSADTDEAADDRVSALSKAFAARHRELLGRFSEK
ncbi:hypothetical protein ACFWBG_28570 [Nocardia salmonicida]|uniref:hypothetical protein n=1 Tax=Nocardia salmonicida TaxID=53431 RepID=UPI003672D9B7